MSTPPPEPRPSGLGTMTSETLSDSGKLLLFAIPKKGRLFDKCDKILKGAGLDYTRANRLDIAFCSNFPVRLVFLPAKDIAKFVGEGDVDLGITGQDMVAECGANVEEVAELGFGKCKLCVQAPVLDGVGNTTELLGKRVATSFPNLTRQYFSKLSKEANAPAPQIKVIGGSVEAACGLGLADAVVDLVETGTTMRAAGLEVVGEVLSTQAVLIANPHSPKKELIKVINKRFQGYLSAQRHSMMYYNIASSCLEAAKAITPGKRAPSVTELTSTGNDEKWYSIGAMVSKKSINNIMDQLQEIGAQDIFVLNIDNCRTSD